jgi:hypothetical protein
MDATEQQVLLPTDIQSLSAGVAPGPSSMNFANAQIPGSSVAFDARGTVQDAGTPIVYAIYLGNSARPTDGYRAITLTPVGRVKVWSASSGGLWHSP